MKDNYLIREISCVFEQLSIAQAMLDRMEISLESLDTYATFKDESSDEFDNYAHGFEAGVAFAKSAGGVVSSAKSKKVCTCAACNSPEWYVMD